VMTPKQGCGLHAEQVLCHVDVFRLDVIADIDLLNRC